MAKMQQHVSPFQCFKIFAPSLFVWRRTSQLHSLGFIQNILLTEGKNKGSLRITHHIALVLTFSILNSLSRLLAPTVGLRRKASAIWQPLLSQNNASKSFWVIDSMLLMIWNILEYSDWNFNEQTWFLTWISRRMKVVSLCSSGHTWTKFSRRKLNNNELEPRKRTLKLYSSRGIDAWN